MFGKFFASAFTGSMCGSGADVFAVWGYVIAHTIDSAVELNPVLLSAVIGMTQERVETAIDTLCAEDKRSRNPENGGRRLVHEGAFLYHVTSHEKYRSIRNEDDRRAYNRDRQRECRARKKQGVKRRVNDSQRRSLKVAHTEAEAEAEADQRERAKALSSSASPAVSAFDAFWKTYPRKVGKGAALKAWLARGAPSEAKAILGAVEAQKAPGCQLDASTVGAKYVPHPSTWLNQRRWEDDPARQTEASPLSTWRPPNDE